MILALGDPSVLGLSLQCIGGRHHDQGGGIRAGLFDLTRRGSEG